MDSLSLQSQDLTEVPESILSIDCTRLNLDFNDLITLPETLCERVCNLTYLSINGNTLETLPPNIHLLSKLEELHLKENALYELSGSLVQLEYLKRLSLTGNELTHFPENFYLLKNLTELVADENKIENLPPKLGQLKFLTHLSLSCNAISNLPETFGDLSNLVELDLSCNVLKLLPESFQHLPALEVLDLTNNRLTLLPEQFSSSKSLRRLHLSQNQLSFIPQWFSDMRHVEEIHLADNRLTQSPFSDDFGDNCSRLTLLDLSGNNVCHLPVNFGKLNNMQILDLGSSLDELERNKMVHNGNELVTLPMTFCFLSNLTKLELDENHLRELPDDFGLLSSLVYLDLNHNLLENLPETFGSLKRLKVCMLSMNYITFLPESFGMIEDLEELKLDSNLLECLPDSFDYLTTLTSLDLYDNKLKEVPQALQKLKALKHLDVRENPFGTELEEQLEIHYEPSYLMRDPKLENNWRGRKRPDIQSWVDKKQGKEVDMNRLENDILFNAMVSASSLWRKHGEKEDRSKTTTSNSLPNGFHSDSCAETENTDAHNSSGNQEDEYWDLDLLPIEEVSQTSNSCQNESKSSDVTDKYEDSDWDTDSEDFPPSKPKIYRHPVKEPYRSPSPLFIPSDLHVKSPCTREVWCPVEEGQFDDADDS